MHKLLLSLGTVSLLTALTVASATADKHTDAQNKQLAEQKSYGKLCNDMADKEKVTNDKRGNYVEECIVRLMSKKK